MAYSTPRTWAHGDTVPASDIQKYSAGLDAIRPKFHEEKISWGVGFSGMADGQRYYIIHKARWLIYVSTGEIRHPTQPDVYPAVSLSDSATINAVDVDQEVDWIVPGVLYEVRGCSLAYEDEVGIIA